MGKVEELLSDPEEIDNITKEIFSMVDTDNNGYVDEKELKRLMIKVANDCGVAQPSDDDVKQAVIAIDTNHDGKISLEEFKVLVIEILKTIENAEK